MNNVMIMIKILITAFLMVKMTMVDNEDNNSIGNNNYDINDNDENSDNDDNDKRDTRN